MPTPDNILEDLIEGNKRFYSNSPLIRQSLISLSQKASKAGQFPKAVILACMDSRSIPEIVFDQSIADIFTLRIAGNVINKDILASMEFAVQQVGVKVIVIMGHTQCVAITAACKGKVAGNLGSLTAAIEPAVTQIKKQDQQFDCNNDATIKNIVMQNVHNMKQLVIEDSIIIRKLVVKKSIMLVGAVHDLESGIVTFLNSIN
jgi:carbonic anhydrase